MQKLERMGVCFSNRTFSLEDAIRVCASIIHGDLDSIIKAVCLLFPFFRSLTKCASLVPLHKRR